MPNSKKMKEQVLPSTPKVYYIGFRAEYSILKLMRVYSEILYELINKISNPRLPQTLRLLLETVISSLFIHFKGIIQRFGAVYNVLSSVLLKIKPKKGHSLVSCIQSP
jgi:hypothetical protein